MVKLYNLSPQNQILRLLRVMQLFYKAIYYKLFCQILHLHFKSIAWFNGNVVCLRIIQKIMAGKLMVLLQGGRYER